MIQTVTQILEENAELFQSKNDDYGNSRQLSGEIMDMIIEGELTLEECPDYIIMGLQTRLLDKVIRSFHLQWNKDDHNHESLVDTYKDLSNYAAMLAHEEQRRNRNYNTKGIETEVEEDEDNEDLGELFE
jgi:hypothetical protein